MPLILKESLEPILAQGSSYLSENDLDLIRRSFEFTINSLKRHNMSRASGEPVIVHPLAVARLLVNWRMDGATTAAGIIHDLIEDLKIGEFQIHATFKDEVAFLVEGVTKLRNLELGPGMDDDTEFHKRIFKHVSDDIRVAIIKLADRLHNMRTIRYLKPKRIKSNCLETKKVFIPLARYLGMKAVKDEYEDIVLQSLNKEGYANAVEAFRHTWRRETPFFERTAAGLRERLREYGIPARIIRRDYNIAHFHEECLINKPLSNEKLSGFLMIITPGTRDCYPALGALHSIYEPQERGFDDKIQFASPDLKRWLESRVIAHGAPFKVRIVSEEMDLVNRQGILPFLTAPSELERTDFLQERLEEIHNLMQRKAEAGDIDVLVSDQFLRAFFVYSKNGKRTPLPPNATVLDYAYQVDTETGNRFVSANVNNQPVDIEHILHGGEQVEIITNQDVRPQVNWLKYAHTSLAQSIILLELSRQSDKQASSTGHQLLIENIKNLGLANIARPGELDKLVLPVAALHEKSGPTRFYEAIGRGLIPMDNAVEDIRKEIIKSATVSRDEMKPLIPRHKVFANEYPGETITTSKTLFNSVYVCEHCTPIPDDAIIARTLSKRTVLHKDTCHLLGKRAFWPKKVPATWGAPTGRLFPARLRLKVFHQEDTPSRIQEAIQSAGAAFITMSEGPPSGDGLEILEILIQVTGGAALATVEAGLGKLRDVAIVTRI